MRGFRALWFFIVVAWLGVICAPARAQTITVVSIGDSYASGEGAPDVTGSSPSWLGDNRDGLAASCHRSNRAAPAVAALLTARPRSFFHFACTGAVVASLTAAGGQLATVAAKVPGPIDALIISIGGNDIGFASLVASCIALPCPAAVNVPASLATLSTSLTALDTAIRAMPAAVTVRHVFLTQYPDPSTTPFPFPDNRCGTVFAPNIPGGGFDTLLAPQAELAVQTVVTPLDNTLATAVAAANSRTASSGMGPTWHFVNGISGAFATHGYCMGWPFPQVLLMPQMAATGRMINTPADSFSLQGDVFGTMHPNASGYAAAASVIAASLNATFPATSSGGGTTIPPSSPSPGVCAKKPWTPGC